MENGCYKLFYILNGRIIHGIPTENVTKDIRKDFIKTSELLIPPVQSIQENEKEWIDFRDIIYSEISDLPEELIELL